MLSPGVLIKQTLPDTVLFRLGSNSFNTWLCSVGARLIVQAHLTIGILICDQDKLGLAHEMCESISNF